MTAQLSARPVDEKTRLVSLMPLVKRQKVENVPKLEYIPEFFPLYWGTPLSSPSEINFTWGELCKSAITVGRRSWKDVLQHGSYSVLEILWRLAMLRANLVEDASGRLIPSDAFKILDRSEKGAVSFFLGMCFTKLIVQKLFGVPWLLHVDVYRASLNPHLAFDTRPDFVGLDASLQWVVVESKGRSWNLPNEAMEKAKLQTRSLRNINGHLPSLKVAIGSYFSATGIKGRVWDPDEYDEDAEDLEIDIGHLARAYYSPLVEYVRLLPDFEIYQEQNQKPRRQAKLLGLDANIVIDEEILNWFNSDKDFTETIISPKRQEEESVLAEVAALKEESSQGVERHGKKTDIGFYEEASRGGIVRRDQERETRISRIIDKLKKSDVGEGFDGVTVELGSSWDREYMELQPEDRKS